MNGYSFIVSNADGESVDLYNDKVIYVASIDGIDYEAEVKTLALSGDGSAFEGVRIPEREISITLGYDSMKGNAELAKLRVHSVFESREPITLRYITPNRDRYITGYCTEISTPPNAHPMITSVNILCPDPFWSDEEFDGDNSAADIILVIYDETGVRLGELDNFISLLWTRKTFSAGDFELRAAASGNNLELLRPVRFIGRSDTGEIMYISLVRDEISNDGSAVISASGYGVSGLLRKLSMPLTQSYYRGYTASGETTKEVSLICSLLTEISAGGSASAETGRLGVPVICGLSGIDNLYFSHTESAERYASEDIERYLHDVAAANGCDVIEKSGFTIQIAKPRETECIFSPELLTSSTAAYECADDGNTNAVRVICSMPSEGVRIGKPGTGTAGTFFVKMKEHEAAIKYAADNYGEDSSEYAAQVESFEQYKRSLLPIYIGTYENPYPPLEPNYILEGVRFNIQTEVIDPVVKDHTGDDGEYSYVDLDETRNLALSTIMNTINAGESGITESYSGDVTGKLKYRTNYDVGDIVTVQTLRGRLRRKISEVQECFEDNSLKISVTFGDVLKTVIDDYNEKSASLETGSGRIRSEMKNNVRYGAVVGGSTVDRVNGFSWDDSDMTEDEFINEG